MNLENILKKEKIKVGDWIEVRKEKEIFKGILMPKTKLSHPSTLILKLENGYNIGIEVDEKTQIKLLRRREIGIKKEEIKLKKEEGKPTVSILGCGGTVASKVEYVTGAVYPAFTPTDLIQSFPRLEKIANIESEVLFNLFSEDLNVEHWKIIAKACVKNIKKNVDGIVLMHGTDTMHFTSAALSFMLQNLPIPIVLVGAQRSSDRGSSDNEMNLISAVLTAAKSEIAEVTVCMHGSINDDYCFVHQGTKVRKMHTSRRDAFKSINVLPYAKVWFIEEKIEYLRENFKKRDKQRKVKVDLKMNPRVGLIWIHPNINPKFIESLSKFYDGIVIAGTGLGHVPTNPFKDKLAKSIVPALKSLIDSGIPVVIAPQTIFGRINLNVYTSGRILKEIGVIGDYCDWLPEVALVKLMWVLGHTKNMKKIKEMMLTNIAGEISERSEVE